MSRRRHYDDAPVTPQHGYDATFEPELDRRYVCPVCLLAIKDAVQTKCGHRFCQSCLANSHGTMRFSRCPADNTWYDTIKDVFLDAAFNREVMSQKVKCSNHTIGCTWTGELRHLEEHESQCPEIEVECSNDCGERHKRRLVVEHLTNCPRRMVTCGHCGENIVAADLVKHELLVCKRFPVHCTACGQTGLLRDQVTTHLDPGLGDCPMAVVPCQFNAVGCQYQEKRKDLDNHNETAVHHHMALLYRQVALCEDRLERHERHLSDIMNSIQQLVDVSVRQGRTIGKQSTELADQGRRLEAIESTSFTGQLLWRIHVPEDFGTFRVVSPSFYTARPGYQFSIVLENAGFEHRGNKYVSVFVQLEKGSYDEQLTFPVSVSCHVSVMGQDEAPNKVQSVVIPCNSMPRCMTDTPPRKVCLKFMKTSELFNKTFLSNDTVLFQAFLREIHE